MDSAKGDAGQRILEQLLVVRVQAGDDWAFEDLVVRLHPRLLAFARSVYPDQAEVDDVLQEVWLAIYRQLPGLRDLAAFRPWVYRIARNKLAKAFRQRRRQVAQLPEAVLEQVPDQAEADEPIDSEELQAGLRRLGEDHREALSLRYLHGLSYQEIAHVMGVNIGTVRSRLHYARQALRQEMERARHE